MALPALAGCGKTLTEDELQEDQRQLARGLAGRGAEGRGGGRGQERQGRRGDQDRGRQARGRLDGRVQEDLVGKRVDPKEMDCLLGAKTIDEINKCSEQP